MKAPNRTQKGSLPSKGWGPFRFEWYSICSAHLGFQEGCSRCQAGHWVNCWKHEVESWVHDNHYDIWFWWTNRPKYTLAEARKEARKYKY